MRHEAVHEGERAAPEGLPKLKEIIDWLRWKGRIHMPQLKLAFLLRLPRNSGRSKIKMGKVNEIRGNCHTSP